MFVGYLKNFFSFKQTVEYVMRKVSVWRSDSIDDL